MSMRQALAAALLSGPLLAQAAVAREGPVVVELFTSQGCSSCPPAEALLNTYAGRAELLPLSFHVTYWNGLGWRDTFSFEGATRRQEAYSGQLGSGSPFTPQIVVDGRYSAVGSRRGEVEAAIGKSRADGGNPAVTLSGNDGRLQVKVGEGSGRGRVLLVGFDRQHTTPVGRGENGGRTIVQSNVVRSLRDLGAWTGRALVLSEPEPVGQDAAVLIQAPDGRILGAARRTPGA